MTQIGTISGHRIIGLFLLAAVGGLILWYLGGVARRLDFQQLVEYFPQILQGLALTIQITAVTSFAGSVLALLVAAARVGRNTTLSRLAHGHVYLFRNSPLLVQLYLVYYGAGELNSQLEALGIWWVFRDPLSCVLIVFTLNTSAYQAHVLSGAIQALPHEQSEAALALGLRPGTILWRVLLPQAILLAIRPLGNELTKMVKASSIASVITIFDLLGTTKQIYSETFIFDFFIVAGVIYVALIECVRIGVDLTSSHFERHRGLEQPTTN